MSEAIEAYRSRRSEIVWSNEGREVCWRCRRARRTCLCAQIRSVSLPFDVVLLVHPEEARKAVATARITELAIDNCEILVGEAFNIQSNNRIAALLADPRSVYLLYPGAESVDVGELEHRDALMQRLRGESRNRAVVLLLDATWRKARKMWYENPWLHELDQICFEPSRASLFGSVRKQPAANCFSTIEAVSELAARVGAEMQSRQLLHAFKYMVDQQLAFEVVDA